MITVRIPRILFKKVMYQPKNLEHLNEIVFLTSISIILPNNIFVCCPSAIVEIKTNSEYFAFKKKHILQPNMQIKYDI